LDDQKQQLIMEYHGISWNIIDEEADASISNSQIETVFSCTLPSPFTLVQCYQIGQNFYLNWVMAIQLIEILDNFEETILFLPSMCFKLRRSEFEKREARMLNFTKHKNIIFLC
jgi:hypothetical protein